MAFSRQQHIALLRGGLDFVPDSDFRYLPINVRLKLAELEKRNGQVYLPKDEVASLKREIAAEKMSEAAKRNDPDASEYFGKDPEYKPNPVTSDPAELRGRLGTDKYGTRPTIYRTVDENSAVFNRRYNPTGLDYDSQYSGSPQTILGRYTPTIRGDEILISPTADKDDPLADKKNETEPHEYMHRGLIPTNPIRRYLLGTIDGATEALGIGNIFGTKAFPFNQHTYIDEVFEREAEKKEQAKIEKQKKLIEEIKQKYGDKKRITRVAKAKGDEVQSLMDELGIQPIGEDQVFKMAITALSPDQKLKKIKLLKKYFDKMRQAESLEKPGAALGDLSDATKLKQGIPYSSSKSIQKKIDQLQGTEKLDLNLLAKLRKELNI